MLTENHFTLFHVFTGKNARGNPAAVTIVETLPDFIEHETMRSHCDTTVYITPRQNNEFDIRWFNDTGSIKRCGHGTLAAAAYLQKSLKGNKELIFYSDTESLKVKVNDGSFSLELPIENLIGFYMQSAQIKGSPTRNYQITNLPFSYNRLAYTEDDQGYLIVELQDELSINEFTLNTPIINAIEKRALIITAKSEQPRFDVVFRYFAPQYGPPEDSATGSAASILWPFWNNQNPSGIHNTLYCYQASSTGGIITITGMQNRICVYGKVIQD